MTGTNLESDAGRDARPAFDPVAAARALLRSARRASLSTFDRQGGFPYVSLIGVSAAEDGAPLMLVSDLARHTVNLKADGRASVLCSDFGKGDPLAHPRVTVFGRVSTVAKDDLKRRWLARQPESEMYFDFGDFSMLRLEPEGAHLVAGFGRIVDLSWQDIRTDVVGAEAVFASEDGVVAHMNEDHADAVRLYATALLGAADGDWRLQGVDPLGCELALDGRALYLPFPERALNAGDVRKALVRLVADARNRTAA